VKDDWPEDVSVTEAEIVEMAVPPIIEAADFEAVQFLLKSRSPALTAPRVVSGPTLLTGICFCAACGKAMTLRREDATATRPARPKPARARRVALAAPSRWRSSTRWLPITSSTAFCSPRASRKSSHRCSTAAGSAPWREIAHVFAVVFADPSELLGQLVAFIRIASEVKLVTNLL